MLSMKNVSLIRFFFALTGIAFLVWGPHARAAVYHVDSEKGDDAASGLSPELAWRSLGKANAVELKPGDQLLLKAGGRWTGRLKPAGNGSKDEPVRIGRYGDGALPRIDGGGEFQDAFLLRNQSFIEVADLEITNLGEQRAPGRTGVRLVADEGVTVEGLVLRRLYVRDVNGDLRKSHEGCGIFFESRGRGGARFKGLLIESCRVERTDRNGICQFTSNRARSTHVVIRGNHLEDIGGDGIKLWGTNGGLIEKNRVRKARSRCNEKEAAAGIWPFACDDTVIQFNEVSETVGTLDGQAYDADYGCRRTTIQYNTSYRNEGGFVLICSPGNGLNDETVIRYNISLYDGIHTARVFHFGGLSTRTRIYNNTVVLGPGQDLPMLLFTEWNGGKARGTRFTNNLFVVDKGGRATYQFGPSAENSFEDNLFIGRHEGLPEGAVTTEPGTWREALETPPNQRQLEEFHRSILSAVKRGRNVEDQGGRDFFGNPVSRDQPPRIGACNF